MSREHYDTKEGIAARIGTYDGLFDVLQERYRVNQSGDRVTFLKPFVVLGRYRSDEFGQLARLSREVFSDDDRANMPPVMTEDEFNELRAQRGIQGWAESSGSPAFCLPRPQTVCSRCGGSWTLETCHDIESGGSEFEDLDLTPYVGKTLREVQQEVVDKQTDGERYIAPESVYIDGSDEDDVQDGDSVSWDYIVQEGEKASVFVYRFYHSACFADHREEEKTEQVEEMRLQLEEMVAELGGFDDVRVTVGVIPERVIQLFAEEEPDFAQEIGMHRTEPGAYWNVSTAQGDFGILQLPYLSIDLTETGITIAQVYPSMAGQMPWDWLLPIGDEEDNTLMQLCNALLKRQVLA